MPIAAVLAGLAAACALGAAIHDVRRFEIADGWSIAIAGLALAALLADGATWGGWGSAGAAAALAFGGGLALFAAGWMGGGDVKLLTALALWTRLDGLPAFLLGTVLAGGVLAIALIALRAVPWREPRAGLLARAGPLPYAVAITGGAAIWAARTSGVFA